MGILFLQSQRASAFSLTTGPVPRILYSHCHDLTSISGQELKPCFKPWQTKATSDQNNETNTHEQTSHLIILTFLNSWRKYSFLKIMFDYKNLSWMILWGGGYDDIGRGKNWWINVLTPGNRGLKLVSKQVLDIGMSRNNLSVITGR